MVKVESCSVILFYKEIHQIQLWLRLLYVKIHKILLSKFMFAKYICHVLGEIRIIHNSCINERMNLKPIFHQNAKYLASGTFASPNAKDSTFASPNARNTNMLVSLALGDASFLRWPCTFLFLCVDFFALGSKRNPHFQWNIGCVRCLASGLCVGHVHFMR